MSLTLFLYYFALALYGLVGAAGIAVGVSLVMPPRKHFKVRLRGVALAGVGMAMSCRLMLTPDRIAPDVILMLALTSLAVLTLTCAEPSHELSPLPGAASAKEGAA